MNPALDLALRAAVLMAAGLIAATLLRGSSAAVRHRVLTATLAAALLVPMLSFVAPSWSLPWTPAPATAPTVVPRAATGTAAPATQVEFAIDSTVAARAPQVNRIWIAGAIWLTGSLVLIFPLAAGLIRLRRVSRDAEVDAGDWTGDARRIGAALGLHRTVRVLRGTRPDLLVAWGWRRPTILVPPHAAHWSADRRQIVLAHELAHLVRGDWMVQLAAECARALHWFNPLAWILSRRLRAESECACDDRVLAGGTSAADYASHLLAIARDLHPRRSPALPAPAMARPTSLEGRVRAMLTLGRDRRPVSFVTTFTIACGAALLTLAAAGAQPALVPVSGNVVDPSGRVLPNVQVSLADPASAARFEVRTDATGRYQFAGVPLADYTLELRVPGFQTVSEPLRVTSAVTRDVSMNVATLQETITVRGGAPAESPADLEARRVKARVDFDALAARGTERCRDNGIPAVGGNIMAPRKLIHVAAAYPQELRSGAVGGTVTLTAVIGTDGSVRDIADVEGPHPALEAAAADAVRDWQFSQTFLNCEPIEVRMKVTTNFVP